MPALKRFGLPSAACSSSTPGFVATNLRHPRPCDTVADELRRLNSTYAIQLAEQTEAIATLSDQHRAAVERADDLQVWGVIGVELGVGLGLDPQVSGLA